MCQLGRLHDAELIACARMTFASSATFERTNSKFILQFGVLVFVARRVGVLSALRPSYSKSI